ncbi:MAG: hypothetical protein LBC61_05100 [Candidatus Peribacteria bacterium]|nr:hypothetical protein [Candidatus Peribacteria bacterium]
MFSFTRGIKVFLTCSSSISISSIICSCFSFDKIHKIISKLNKLLMSSFKFELFTSQVYKYLSNKSLSESFLRITCLFISSKFISYLENFSFENAFKSSMVSSFNSIFPNIPL